MASVLDKGGSSEPDPEPGEGDLASTLDSLSVLDPEGLELPPNILFSRLPPWEERLRRLLPASFVELRQDFGELIVRSADDGRRNEYAAFNRSYKSKSGKALRKRLPRTRMIGGRD